MQNKNFTLDGSGKATITAPCPCEAVDLYITGATPHTFTFAYALRPDEGPILAVGGADASGMPDPSKAGQPIGDAISAAQWSANYFEFKAESGRFKPWAAGEVVGFVVGTAADVVVVRPRRPGGS